MLPLLTALLSCALIGPAGETRLAPVLYIPFALWALAWVLLLCDCLRRHTFPGTLGSGPAGRGLWLLTFALLDPFLTAAYLVFVVLRVGRGARWTSVVAILGLAVASIGWVDRLLPVQARTWVRDAEESGPRRPALLEFAARFRFERIETACSQMSPALGTTVGPPRRVEIVLQGGGSELSGAARWLAAELGRVPAIERIDIVPQGASLSGERAPDLRLRLTSRRTRWPAVLSFSPWTLAPLEREIVCQVTPWRSSGVSLALEPGPGIRPPQFVREGGTSVSYGLQMGGQRDVIAVVEPLTRELVQNLRAALAASEPTDLPEALYGTWREPPRFAFLERLGATRIVAESDLLVHTKAVWTFRMPDREQLERIRDELRAAGFSGENTDPGEPRVEMENGSEWISIAAWPDSPGASPWTRSDGSSLFERPEIAGLVFEAQYRRGFDAAQRKGLTSALLAHGDPGLLGAWASDCDAEDRRTIHDHLRSVPVNHPFELLTRAYLARRLSDSEALADWVRRASVYRDLGYEPLPGQRRFAEALAPLVEALAEAPRSPDRADLVAAGVRFLDEGPVTRRVGVDGVLAVGLMAADETPLAACLQVHADDAGRLALSVSGLPNGSSMRGPAHGPSDELHLEFELASRTIEVTGRPRPAGLVELCASSR